MVQLPLVRRRLRIPLDSAAHSATTRPPVPEHPAAIGAQRRVPSPGSERSRGARGHLDDQPFSSVVLSPNGPYLARPGVILWQSRGFRHNRFHVDYSQWVPRFVHPRMRVDGRNVATAEVMMSPELAGLVSYQGPLLGTRYPLWEYPALTTSSPSRPASTSRHETSSPLDFRDTASPFDPFADLRRNAPWER